MDPQLLQELQNSLSQCLSPNNDIRKQAESMVHAQIENNRDMFLFGLITLLTSCQDQSTRSLCAIILRRRLPTGEPVLFDLLGDDLRNKIKSDLLQALTTEQAKYVQKQINHTICELAEVTLHKNEWNELLPFLFQCGGSDNANLRFFSIRALATLVCTATDSLLPHTQTFLALFQQSLEDSVFQVRVQAAKALCRAIPELEVDNKQLQPLVANIMQILGDALNQNDDDSARTLLLSMIDLALIEGTFFRSHLASISTAMLAIGRSTESDDGVKRLCMEFLVTIAEYAPGMARKCSTFVDDSVQLCLTLMLQVEDDGDWHLQKNDDESYDESNFQCGEMSLDRLAQAVEGACIVPIVFPLICQFVANDGDWKFRHTGLKALAQVGEVMEFDQLPINETINFCGDAHPRVRHAAIHCIGQLSSDFGPRLQESYHPTVVPALLKALEESSVPRIQAHACSAMFNFVKECDEQLVAPYIETILMKLVSILSDNAGMIMVKEKAMTAIAAVSGAAPVTFEKYYSSVVPIIKQVIVMANTKEMATLRSCAMEAISFIGMEVSKSVFKEDAKEVMNIFIDLMKSGNMASDDTTEQYMLQAWTRLASTLGDDFLPILPLIIPSVFKQASKKINWGFNGGNNDDDEDERSPYMAFGGQAVTSAIEEKATACSMLCSFVNDLKDSFLPFLEQTANIMFPLTHYYMSTEVRSYAVAILPDLVNCVVLSVQKGKADQAMLQALVNKVMECIMDGFKMEVDNDIRMALVGSLQMVVSMTGELSKQLIGQDSLHEVGKALLKMLTDSHERIHKREQKAQNDDDFDEYTEAKLMGENAAEDELNYMVAECMTTLIKSHKEEFLPTFELLLPEILRMLAPNSLASTRKIAVFIYDDVIEHVGLRGAQYFDRFMPALLTYTNDKSQELRQASAYGLAMCATHGGEYFQPYVESAVKVLVTGITAIDARADENASPTDNMISALGKIAHHQKQPQLYTPWLEYMPLTADRSEAITVYNQLCALVEANDEHILGEQYKNLAKIILVMCHTLMSDFLEYIDGADELKTRMCLLLKEMKNMPAELLSAVANSYTPDEQTMMKNVFDQL